MSAIVIGSTGFGRRRAVSAPVRRAPRPNAGVTPRLRITRRGRAVLAVLVAVPLAAGGVVVGLGQQAAAESSSGHHTAATADYRYITVGSGESLWSIARSIAPNADPRDVVDRIVSLNQLPSADLSAGQRIAVPTDLG